MNEEGLRRALPDQSSGSGHTFGTSRHPSVNNPILSKRVCFYKSGDPQFSGLRLVINNRTFKTFDALLDSLSKKVPLPFGVRNITTPRGVHGIRTLDELEDGKSYICSDSRKIKPINLAQARKKLPPWYHARPVSSNRRNVQKARFFPGRSIHKREQVVVRTPKKLTVFRNGDPTEKHTVLLHKKTTPSYESILEYISQLMQFHVVKLLTPDGKRVDGLPGLILCSGIVVAVGREPFKPAIYSSTKAPPSAWLQTRRQKNLKRKFINQSPQSSLSFSYDSSIVITTEPESNTVRSIRQMFLAKSPIDVQPRRFPRPNSSMRPKIRAETSVSGGYQSQTSDDLSSFEDDSPRRSITKGFVRRTIERLDSEPCQDDVNKGSVNEESLIELEDISKDTKLLTERNSLLPAVGDIKLKDNRVHPLGNPPTDGDVVVQQPGKGQGVVNRQVYEPDMLDFLYNFCGQNCPIL
ncbi:oxygen-regulated protein 1-like [Gouania willdenowi]|uniref:oxygen-regulated protein 1-like n=1 Tax=Gouania willdenowi TaxID=441366 RepID=UPI001055330F|nr:oxygen-regulated protein 1-like [Gouania willdenowi]